MLLAWGHGYILMVRWKVSIAFIVIDVALRSNRAPHGMPDLVMIVSLQRDSFHARRLRFLDVVLYTRHS